MEKERATYRGYLLGVLMILGILFIGVGLQGCQNGESTIENETKMVSEVANFSPSPDASSISTQTSSVENDSSSPSEMSDQPLWADRLTPSIPPATPIPPPLGDLALEDDILVWILLGSDTEPPFAGQTQAIHLLFINPRFSKASLVSIPGDLYVYIPGHTMQRLNIAYSIGGIETLRMTLAYNFGVVPDRFVLAHPGDFKWLVDDLNTVEVTVFYPIPQACGGIRAGLIQMDGTLALCYASYRNGMDEIDRMRRQQQLLRVIFRNMTQDGNLIQLPVFFASYQGWVKTDFSLPELMGYIPLALRLADPDRVGYYMIGWDQISIWEVPGYSQAKVFLPDQEKIKALLQGAIDDIMIPSPLTDQVQTLEAQLTAAYGATATAYHLITPSPTTTPTPTGTQEIPAMWITPSAIATITPPGYP